MKNVILGIWAILPVLLFLCGKDLNAQGVSINPNGNPPDPSAIMDINSSSQGLLIPRMSTAQRDAISSPAEGLQIFNTTTKCYESYVYDTWQSVWCGQCPPVSSPASAAHAADTHNITWNWNAVSGAAGYKWNTINNYASATDNGPSTSYQQSGLSCNTTYELYVWSYTTCGAVSPVLTLNESTINDESCFVQATGGSVTTVGDYKVHTFTSSGNFTVTNGGSVEYLVVGGGGGGGYDDGGGGAGAPGAVSGQNVGGNGGAGLSSSISGSLQYYAGGGGGGAEGGPGTPGNGGVGGGGTGGGPNNAGSPASPNTGGGGGGGSGGSVRTGGNGGSGIVIIRYLFQ